MSLKQLFIQAEIFAPEFFRNETFLCLAVGDLQFFLSAVVFLPQRLIPLGQFLEAFLAEMTQSAGAVILVYGKQSLTERDTLGLINTFIGDDADFIFQL